jgi:hypothetical protein
MDQYEMNPEAGHNETKLQVETKSENQAELNGVVNPSFIQDFQSKDNIHTMS